MQFVKFRVYITYIHIYETIDTADEARILTQVPPSLKLSGSVLSRGLGREAPILSSRHTHMVSSDQISRSVVSDPLRPHESQHARPPCFKTLSTWNSPPKRLSGLSSSSV